MPSLEQWNAVWRDLQCAPPAAAEYRRLLELYAQPHRAYHSVQHLDECLTCRDLIGLAADHPAQVELALWYHDAVYELQAPDNEARSAALADEVTTRAGLASEVRGRIRELILVTRRDGRAPDRDATTVLDVDLSSLAAAPERFDECERQLRAERPWLEDDDYRALRRAELLRFQGSARLFHTATFHERFDARARDNIARVLKHT